MTWVLDSIVVLWVSHRNHIPMNIDYDKNADWFSAQLQATYNVNQSLFNDWFTGLLNFQIEHQSQWCLLAMVSLNLDLSNRIHRREASRIVPGQCTSYASKRFLRYHF
ncbi:unnamed protein product [Caretta caretta]